MSPRRRAQAIRTYLDSRIANALEWYRGCLVCDETRTNIQRDLMSVLDETERKFGIKRMPFMLRAHFDGPDIIVTTLSREVS